MKKSFSLFSILLCFLLIFNLFKPQKSEAIIGIDDTIIIGGVAVSTEAIAALVGCSLVVGGVYLSKNTDSEYIEYISKSMMLSGEATKNFAVRVGETGKAFLSWTYDGATKFVDYISDSISEKFMLVPNKYVNLGSNSIYTFTFDDLKKNSGKPIYRVFSFSKSGNYKISFAKGWNFESSDYSNSYTSRIKTKVSYISSQDKCIVYYYIYDYDGNVYSQNNVSVNSYDTSNLVLKTTTIDNVVPEVSNGYPISDNSSILSTDTDQLSTSITSGSTDTYSPAIEIPILPKEIQTDPDNDPEKVEIAYVPGIEFPDQVTGDELLPTIEPGKDPDDIIVVNPDGSITNPDGSKTYPDGTTVYPNGTTISPDGSTTYPDGTVVKPDGTTIHPDGTTTNPDGTTTSPDGSTTNPDGSTINPDLTVPNKHTPTLDFGPMKVVTRKFPFSIPWDVWECFKTFEGDSKPLKYKFDQINYNSGEDSIVIIPEFTIDFSEYPKIVILITLFKYLLLLSFIYMLIRNTRTNFIRG